MPDDNDGKIDINVGKGSKADDGAELPHANLEPTPLSSPIPSIEQEPQTSTLAGQPNKPLNQLSNQPQSATNGTAFPMQPQVPGSSKGSKRKWLIGGIIAGVVVLLAAGGAMAYFTYQNPDKVVADGLVNLFNSQPHSMKATMTAKNSALDMNINFDIKGNDKAAAGTLTAKVAIKEPKLDLEGSVDIAATTDGTGYLKLKDVDVLADKVVDAILKSQADQYKAYGMTITDSQISTQKKEMLAQVDPIIKKINNRWIKLSADKPDDSVSKEQKCFTDAIKKLQSDKTMSGEFAKVYADNKFLNVKEQLGVKDGSYGFVLDSDMEKAKSFGKAAQETSFFKELEKCQSTSSDGLSMDDSSSSSASDVRVELWVSQWSHQITRVVVEGSDTSASSDATKVKLDIGLGYEDAGDVTVPADAVDFKDLQKEFEGFTPTPAAGAAAPMMSI